MTARTIVPERRLQMSAAILLLLAVLLAAGSIQPAAQNNQTITIPVTPAAVLSDKELAEQTIAEAREKIEKADAVIGWFKGNASTRDDPQLPPIIAKREVAASYLSTAEDEIAAGNYHLARVKAENAHTLANISYTDLSDYQRCPATPCTCPKVSFSLDRVLLLLALCIFPALLTSVLHSMLKTISLPLVNRVHRPVRQVPARSVLIIAWIIFSLVTLSVFFAITQSANIIAWYISFILGFLVLAVMIPAIMVVGRVIVRTLYRLTGRGTSVFTYDDTTMLTQQERKRNYFLVLALVILILLMPLVILIGARFSMPPLCM